MKKADLQIQIPRKEIIDPLEKLSGTIRRAYREIQAAANAFSDRRFVGIKDEQWGRFYRPVFKFEPKEVEQALGFAAIGKLSGTVVDVTCALADVYGVCAPYLHSEQDRKETLGFKESFFFEASLLWRTSAPFREDQGKLRTPRGEWDLQNKAVLIEDPGDICFGPWSYRHIDNTLSEKGDVVTFRPGGEGDTLSPYKLFKVWPFHTRHIHSGFSNLSNGQGRIWAFPCFYYRSLIPFWRLAPYQGFGDPLQQVLAAQKAWGAMEAVLSRTPSTFEGLQAALAQMPTEMLGSYWPGKATDAPPEKRKQIFAAQFADVYAWNKKKSAALQAAPSAQYGQIDWSTYRFAHALEHIGLSLTEAQAKRTAVSAEKERESVGAFLKAARAYGRALVDCAAAFGAEIQAADPTLQAYEKKGLIRQIFSKAPPVSYSARIAQLYFGPEVVTEQPHAPLKSDFLAAAGGLFTAQGLQAPWTPEAIRQTRLDALAPTA